MFISCPIHQMALSHQMTEVNHLVSSCLGAKVPHLCLESQIKNHKSQILNHKSQILNHKSQILNQKKLSIL